MNIIIKAIPVKAYWSISRVKQYYSILQRAYNIVIKKLKDITGINKSIKLQITVKAVNNTTGLNKLIPTLLVFGMYPKISKSSIPNLTLSRRLGVIEKAIKEV